MTDETSPLKHPENFSFREIDRARKNQQRAEVKVVRAAEKVVRRAHRKMKPPERV